MKRKLQWGALAVAGVLGAAWGCDYALVRLPGKRTIYADIRVDQLYTSTNKWHEVEWSRGNTVYERCVYSLFPHFGYTPCWYLQRHAPRITNTD